MANLMQAELVLCYLRLKKPGEPVLTLKISALYEAYATA